MALLFYATRQPKQFSLHPMLPACLSKMVVLLIDIINRFTLT